VDEIPDRDEMCNKADNQSSEEQQRQQLRANSLLV
jgi:hypothetical protein